MTLQVRPVIGAVTVVLAVAVSASACSGGEAAIPEGVKPLAMADQSSAVSHVGDAYTVHWTGLLTNPNRTFYGEFPVAQITARDAGGNVIVSQEQQLGAVPPGGSIAFTGAASVAAPPTAVSVAYKRADWQETELAPALFRPFPVSLTSTQQMDGQGYRVIGSVHNPFAMASPGLLVTAMLRGADGKLIGGGTTLVSSLPPGTRRTFVVGVDAVSAPGPVAKAELMAAAHGSSRSSWQQLAGAGLAPPRPRTELPAYLERRAR